jgi:hypothetical protein
MNQILEIDEPNRRARIEAGPEVRAQDGDRAGPPAVAPTDNGRFAATLPLRMLYNPPKASALS